MREWIQKPPIHICPHCGEKLIKKDVKYSKTSGLPPTYADAVDSNNAIKYLCSRDSYILLEVLDRIYLFNVEKDRWERV